MFQPTVCLVASAADRAQLEPLVANGRTPQKTALRADRVVQWAPTLLILGLYNKLVKQLGSDATSRIGA